MRGSGRQAGGRRFRPGAVVKAPKEALDGRLSALVLRRRWAVLVATLCVALAAVWWGGSAHEHLTAGGEAPASAESMRAKRVLERDFGSAVPDVVLIARARLTVDDPGSAAAARRVEARLRADPAVASVRSYWSTTSAALRSRDGRSALILVQLDGEDAHTTRVADRLVPQVTGRQGELTVSATGEAALRAQVGRQVEKDRVFAELLALPVTALMLLFAFRSAVAAVLPVLVGALAVTATAAVLRLATVFTPVSVFASSISYALGFALAVDYSLFIISRFREELDNGRSVEDSLQATLSTAGRAVAFSAATVATSLAALFIFPLPILRSIALGGITVTVSAAALSLLVLPAVLCLLGRRTDRFDLFAPLRRGRATRTGTMARAGTNDQDMPRSADGPTGTERGAWGRIAALVMRRPAVVSLALAAGLAVMASPFTRVEFGMFDDRLFPITSEIGRSGQALRQDFTDGGVASPTTVMLPGFNPATAADRLDRYARAVSAVPRVRRVETATGSYEKGSRVRGTGPASASYADRRGAWLSVTTDCEPFSAQARRVALAVRALPAPGPALVGGPGAVLADMHQSIADRLWQACALIVAAMTILVLALTRRPVLALKAVLLNALSLSATFGALVFVFQDGHLAGLLGGFTATGTTDIQMPVLIFCIAFGLSMDYEVFLLARICEEYRRVPSTAHAVVAGLDRTAGLFTWAAVIFATVMAALATSDLVLLKVIGVGLALAVVLDATVIRGLLVPAVMAVAGRANWWTFGCTAVEGGVPARRIPRGAPSRTTEPQLPSARHAAPAPGPELPKGERP